MERQLSENRLSLIENEIRALKQKTALNILEIGDKLNEAKAIIPHGQWSAWLENNVDISARTARNFMAISRAFAGNRQALANTDATKLIYLTELSNSDRESFLQEHNINSMTTRQVKAAVDEAKQKEILTQPLFTDEMKKFHQTVMKSDNLELVQEWHKFLHWLLQEESEIILDLETRTGELLQKEG